MKILQATLDKNIDQFPENRTFMNDNAMVHRAQIVEVSALCLVLQTPMNLLSTCGLLGPSSAQPRRSWQLLAVAVWLIEKGHMIPRQFIENMIASTPRRVRTVIGVDQGVKELMESELVTETAGFVYAAQGPSEQNTKATYRSDFTAYIRA